MSKKFISVLICFFMAAVLTIGSGVALFYFDQGKEKDDNQRIEVGVEDFVELGKIEIIEDGATTEPGGVTYEETFLFMDLSSVYAIGADNPSKKKDFSLAYTPSGAIPDGYTVSLVCEVSVLDTDNRGVIQDLLPGAGIGEDDFIYSASLLDYFEPVNISFPGEESEALRFVRTSGDETSHEEVYQCEIFRDVANKTPEEIAKAFHVNFRYKEYTINNGSQFVKGDMSPSCWTSTVEGYQKIIGKMIEARHNSEMAITFRLALKKGDNLL